ncbi:hypothetical protein [Gallaecimonas xiamenensis]|uniref:Uncharacterized protein n=1 Tax=Gallaecimonas xiamenensis 3-C-1 TaxID=745411 RepID=K2JSA3_9GAMM|nr:hypothetical protein [Gallaecimonas xiamenensis]EKE77392.1 hypothetical protein B3C1_01235 [Gallaecimonas xiamenensis 3-C-1]
MQAEQRFEAELKQRLGLLAPPDPDPVLWQNIAAASPARRRYWPWLGTAAALVLAAVVMLPRTEAPLANEAGPYELQAQDRQLQLAYLNDASPAELDRLWQARQQLTLDMAKGHRETK